ncbi:MAG: hypothetical protein ABEJ65_02200 [bacterium]
MKDTLDNLENEYRSQLMKRPPEERLKMGCRMFAMARQLYLDGLEEDLTEEEKRRKLREFLYE